MESAASTLLSYAALALAAVSLAGFGAEGSAAAMLALWPRLVSGGILLMGDYGYSGSKLAADMTALALHPSPYPEMTPEKRLVLRKP